MQLSELLNDQLHLDHDSASIISTLNSARISDMGKKSGLSPEGKSVENCASDFSVTFWIREH